MSGARRPLRAETTQFRQALVRLRDAVGWSQEVLASRLGVSRRTVSNWECGYWLPPFNQRMHIVVAVSEGPSNEVLEIAHGLGVSTNPAVAPLLRPHREALGQASPDDGRAARRRAPLVAGSPADALRMAVDAVVRDEADALNMRADDLRAAIGRALAVCGERGATLDVARNAVAVRATSETGKARG